MESKNESKTWYDKLAWLWVIVIFILAIVTFTSDPPILTVSLAVIVIAGCIMCFARKYKLKFFTVIALLVGIFCLYAGIRQAKDTGWLVTPDYGKRSNSVASSAPVATTNKTTTNTTKTNTTKTNTTKTTSTATGVDPDLKKFLDSYEAFIDEYVDFMKKYMNDPGNAISMLSEYTQIMTKYEDFAEKVDEYDSNEMSKEDAKYYLDVVNRCNKKMLDVY